MNRIATLFIASFLALGAPTTVSAAPGDGIRAERREAMQGRFLEALRRADPERHRKVIELRDERPRLYGQLVVQAASMLRGRGEDPGARQRLGRTIDEAYTLHTQLDAFAIADEKARRKMRPEIEATVGRLFELRQEARRAQLAELEERLGRLRADIQARDGNKEQLVGTFTDTVLDAMEKNPGF